MIANSARGFNKNVQNEAMVIDRGEAEVDNHIQKVNILTNTLSGVGYIYFITSKPEERYVLGHYDLLFG